MKACLRVVLFLLNGLSMLVVSHLLCARQRETCGMCPLLLKAGTDKGLL